MSSQIRPVDSAGAHEEEHNFTIPGLKWRQESNSPNSGWKNSEFFGIDEYFNLDIPIVPDTESGSPASVDYIYTVGAELEGMWNGVWGILRSYGTKQTGDKLLFEVPEHTVGRNGYEITNDADYDGICPVWSDDARTVLNPTRSFDVTAVRAVDILGDQGIVYNNRDTLLVAPPGGLAGKGPLIDPTALMYVLTDDLVFDADGNPVGLKPGVPVEPLILRANAGDCITVNLTNALLAHGDPDLSATEMPGYNALPPIVHKKEQLDEDRNRNGVLDEGEDTNGNGKLDKVDPGKGGILTFNANDLTPSSYVGLTPQLLAFDPRTDGGFSTGLTTGKLVAPGESGKYKWYAGDVRVTTPAQRVKGNRTQFTLEHTPVEFGAVGLMPADRIKGSESGFVGAMVIEPQYSTWVEDPGTRAQATVYDAEGNPLFRDFVVIMQNDVNFRFGGDASGSGGVDCTDPLKLSTMDCAVPSITADGPLGPPEDPQDSGQKAINYGADPLWFRLGISPDTPFDLIHRDSNLPGDHDIPGVNLSADIPNLFANSLVGGDPQVPVFRASPDGPDEGRFRVLMPGGHARGVTWTLHGHQWERQPYTCVSDGGSPAKCVPGTGSSMIGDRNDPGTGTGSDYYGTQEGINPTGHWDIVVDLGGNADVHGDYLLGDQASFGRYQGLWGLLRFDFTPPVAVDAEISTPKYLCDAAGANCQPGTADIDLLALASDLDGDAASVEITTGPGFGTLTPTGGTVTFTYPLGTPWPCADPFACSTSFTYTVTDAQGLESNTGAVTVTVTNTAPVVNDDSIIIKTPDTSGSVDVLLNDFDAEGDVAEDRIRSVDLGTPTDPNGVGGTAGVLNGVVTYSGPFDSAGVVSVPYTVTDESGAVSNTAHVRIAVNVDDVRITNARYQPVNDHWTVGGTCTDPVHLDGSTPTIITIYSGMSLPSPGFDPPVVGTAPCLAGDPIGTWAFSGTSTAPEPDPNAFNLVSAQSDFMTGGGGFHLAYPVEFAGQNNPPVAVDDGYTIDEDQVLNGDVLANDADADFDPLTVFKVSGPSNGTVVLNPDGTFTYTPDANWSGVDTFQYQADDGKALSNLATVTITVNPVNDAPFAFGEGYAMAQGTVLNVVEPGVLGNDSDVEGDYITLNTTPVSGPAAGNSLTLNADGSFTYTPDPLFTGTDSFVYQICETENPDVCSQATVTISVGVNDAPVAVDDQYITPQITATQLDPLEVAAPGVLDNDTDADGDPLTVSAVNGNPASVGVQITLASGATLTLNIDGSFTYTPVFNFVGTDSFTYVANDGTVDSNTATVTIAVEDVVTVTSARFRPGRRGAPGRWNIQGTVSYSLSQVNVYLVRPGADPVLIGPASVDAITGDWSFNGTSTVVGAEGDTVRAVSSGGGEGEYVLQAGDIR